MWARIGLRLLRQEARRGELTIILLALILAVSAVFSLGQFSQRIQAAMLQKSAAFLAADRLLNSAYPVDKAIVNEAENRGIERAELLYFNSMLFAGDNAQLVNVKAIKGAYPLVGELEVRTESGVEAYRGPPPEGSVFLADRAAQALGVSLGDTLELGEAELRLSGYIVAEPDASFSVFTTGPRLMMNQLDIPATQVVQPGSRLSYSYLFAGETQQLEAFYTWLKPQLVSTQRWRDVRDGDSPLANALERADKFLMLASLLGIVLAATAIAVATRRYTQRHMDMVAVLKTLGASRQQIQNIFLLHLILLTAIGTVVGLMLGAGLETLALKAFASYLPAEVPEVGPRALLIAVATGLICSVLFSIGPLWRMFNVPPLRVIRHDLVAPGLGLWGNAALILAAVYILLWMFSSDWQLSGIILLSGGLVVAVMLGLSHLLLRLGRKAGFKASSPWQLALAGLYRRAMANAMQMISVAIALMLMLIIVVLKQEMLEEWRNQLPEDTPNHFLINVAQYEVEPINRFFADYQLASTDLFPVVRGRLAEINDEKVRRRVSKEDEEQAEQGRRGVGRELNLTWSMALPEQNSLLEGQWWQDGDTRPLVSVESGLAERLDIRMGDKLGFVIGGLEVSVEVASIREVNWRSMRPNFFMIFNDQVLQQFNATYIASFHLSSEQKALLTPLLQAHPTVSVIEVDVIIAQIQSVIEQVSVALEYIMWLVVAASTLVLIVQIQASFAEREHQMVILRTLGAKGRLIWQSVFAEFALLGGFAGLIAAFATELALYFLQTLAFDMQWQPHPELWLIACAVGATGVAIVGVSACRQLLTTGPMAMMRNLG